MHMQMQIIKVEHEIEIESMVGSKRKVGELLGFFSFITKRLYLAIWKLHRL